MKFEPLTDAERSWLDDQISQAAVFAGDSVSRELPSLEALDEAFEKFIGLGQAASPTSNQVVLAVGAAFGEHLVRKLGFEWGIVTDDYGTDIAVLARPGRGDYTIFPTDFVAKRWERKETRFLVASIGSIAKTIQEAAADWNDASPGRAQD